MKTGKLIHGLNTIAAQAYRDVMQVNAHVPPIYQTSTFIFPDAATARRLFSKDEDGYIYTRWNNPNQDQVARKIACLEGLELLKANPSVVPGELVDGTMFASGMAAISSVIFAKLLPGDTVIAQRSLYGGTYDLLNNFASQYGIKTEWVETLDPDAWQMAVNLATGQKLLIAESPANPLLAIVDLKAVAQIAHQADAWLLVDNTFASPYCQRPLSLGADIVIHSTTKYLSGHGQVIGGVVVSTHPDFIQERLQSVSRLLGAAPSPFDCWLTDMGMRTFGLRMERHCQNAARVAEYLLGHPQVARVYYPGLDNHGGHEIARQQMSGYGGMVSFELKKGYPAGEALMNNLHLITLAVSLGTVDSLICHPASMTHASVPAEVREKMGIRDGLIRFSVGIEDIEDILSDLAQALA